MYFTKFLKGIPESPDLNEPRAESMLLNDGIICNWWRNSPNGAISPAEIKDKLKESEKFHESNLYWHLERYDRPKPPSNLPFNHETPFISTTAGVVERLSDLGRNIVHSPLLTALHFATNGLLQPGYIFYGYVITLGKRAVPFQEYAEEVRELNIYTPYLRYHDEGELVAKIHIPSHRLERVERWDMNMIAQFDGGQPPTHAPPYPKVNPGYSAPENYSNIRELLSEPGGGV